MFKVLVLLCIVALCYAEYVKVGTTDEDVVKAADEAAKQLSRKFSGKFQHKLAKIINARKQEKDEHHADFIINIIVGQTTCTKEETGNVNLDECDFQTGSSTFKKCVVVVFRRTSGDHNLAGSGCILADKDDLEGIE